MKRVLSGVKPTGELTLGNYLGAMRRLSDISNDSTVESFFFIPDLHALNSRPQPQDLRRDTISVVAWMLAMGVNTSKSVIFKQSSVNAHSEMTAILNNYVTMGELSRMTQFKDKLKNSSVEGQLVGLFDYPVMMAADILLYDVHQVPVGDDQRQHIELTRGIADRFNNIYGDIFVVPEADIQPIGARIMDLQDPTKKMSKSNADLSGCILLSDSQDVMHRKISRAVTDSGSIVQATDDKPAITNMLVIYSMLSGKEIADIELEYAGKGYFAFKTDLANIVIDSLSSLQQKHDEYVGDSDLICDCLVSGKERAEKVADKKMLQVKTAVGLV